MPVSPSPSPTDGPDQPATASPPSERRVAWGAAGPGLGAGRAGAEVREHPLLLVLYLFALATPLLAWPDPPLAVIVVGGLGAVSLALLLLRLVLVGFTGYELQVGLRIISRRRRLPGDRPVEQRPIWRRSQVWLIGSWSTAALGLGLLLAANHYIDPADTATLDLIRPFRLGLVFYVAIACFAGLLILIGQRFSVFGTTSIIGVVLGVAALLVVQSVATGFQHDFERRVVGVYAHINVTHGFGISEYRRFQGWVLGLDGVAGASPFVYHGMALAPRRATHGPSDVKLASVLVKGIDPQTAGQVNDLPLHLLEGSGRPIPLTDLRSDLALLPIPDRDDDALPEVIAATPDPRGDHGYYAALERWAAAQRDQAGRAEDLDDWQDPPDDLDAPESTAEADADLPTLFIGVTLAQELGLAVGDVVRLVDPGAALADSDQLKFVDYRVAGVFRAGFNEYDSRLVYADIKELQRFKYRGEDRVSGIDLRLRDPDQTAVVAAQIREALNGPELEGGPPPRAEYIVLEWQKLNENLFSTIRSGKQVTTIILSLVIFVASFNVLSALWTMVIRRTPEVAIIMSMGATGPQVARIFQVTGMAIGLAGALAGVAFGLTMCWLVELYGYALDPDVYFIERLPVEVSVVQIGWILALALGICFLATIPPSLRAARLRPVEGLRYE
jgi:lipoprotein-releasing system permease protein